METKFRETELLPNCFDKKQRPYQITPAVDTHLESSFKDSKESKDSYNAIANWITPGSLP